MLNEFVDRFGPRMAHLNGLLASALAIERHAKSDWRAEHAVARARPRWSRKRKTGQNDFPGQRLSAHRSHGRKTVLTPFLVWSGLGPHFGLGEARGKVDRKAAVGVAIALAVVILILLILQKGR